METLEEYKDSFLNFINSQETVYLSTIDEEGYPSTRAMLNLKNSTLYPHLLPLYEKEENPFTIYLSTNTASIKMREIGENDKVCLYFCNSDSYMGITLKGEIQPITDNVIKRIAWKKDWERYYEGGIDSVDFTLLRFIPNNIKSFGGGFIRSKQTIIKL